MKKMIKLRNSNTNALKIYHSDIKGKVKTIEKKYLKRKDVEELIIKKINELEKDFSEGSKKPLLIPRNNREYWLFTEFRQRLLELLLELGEMK